MLDIETPLENFEALYKTVEAHGFDVGGDIVINRDVSIHFDDKDSFKLKKIVTILRNIIYGIHTGRKF